MYHGLLETIQGFTKNLYFGMGSSLVIALPAIAFTLLDGLLPTAVLLGGLAGPGPAPGTPAFSLALAVALLTAAVRGALHLRLGYSVASILLHPLFIIAMGLTGLRSTWVNGVRGRHTWRGRETDARGLRF